MIYGIEIEDSSNKYLQLVEGSLESAVEGLLPGAFWVDYLPILKYVPAWLPGAGFKTKAQKWRELVISGKTMPFEAARIVRVRAIFLICNACNMTYC